jgi:AAA domain
VELSAVSVEPFRLLSVQDLASLPPRRWLIPGLLPEGGLAGLFGATNSGKSFLALNSALSVASGFPWLGSDVERRPVIYVAAEGHTGLQDRVAAWQETHAGADLSQIHWLTETANLLEGGQVERVRATLESLPHRLGLLVIDTMARSMVGGEENSAKDVGRLIAAVDGLREGGAALIVHHSGHDGEHERGSSALRAAVDVMAKVERRDKHSRRFSLKCVKSRDAPEFGSIELDLELVGPSCVVSRWAAPEVAVEQAPDLDDRLLAYVEEHGPVSGSKVVKAVKGQRAEITWDALRGLEARSLLITTPKGLQAIPGARESPGSGSREATVEGDSESGEERRSLSPSGIPRSLSDSREREAPLDPEESTDGQAPDLLAAAVGAEGAAGERAYAERFKRDQAEGRWGRR